MKIFPATPTTSPTFPQRDIIRVDKLVFAQFDNTEGEEVRMPKLLKPGGGFIFGKGARQGFRVISTTLEDDEVIKALGLKDKVDIDLEREEAEEVLRKINDAANRLRNPPVS